jgi:hypothetical protein
MEQAREMGVAHENFAKGKMRAQPWYAAMAYHLSTAG